MGPVLVRRTGVVIVGGGVAGLSAALATGPCAVITMTPPGVGGSSPLAQGGIAAAIAVGDSTEAHAADTIEVSAGLAIDDVVERVTDGGPAAIEELVALGANFDRDPDGALALGSEAGHRARRIVHANGDATGAEIMARLAVAVEASPAVEVFSGHTARDLIVSNGRVVGVLVTTPEGRLEGICGHDVIMATGGYAHSFAKTTTSAEAIGTGIVLAARAGAAVADMEFVQFHPTALDVSACSGSITRSATVDRLPLMTEALRGEGATLIDDAGHRYLLGQHPDAELAPRDVVARANYRHLAAGHQIFLDARCALGARFDERFPTVARLTRAAGLDPTREPIPVTPAAHYCMGGIAVDGWGRSSIPGLWAVGETAASGMHGANRLASNSLLEGLVMGRLVGRWTARLTSKPPAGDGPAVELRVPAQPEASAPDHQGDAALGAELRQILWRSAGVERHADGLRHGLAELARLQDQARLTPRSSAVHAIARLVMTAALARTESRGAHVRLDHPEPDPAQVARSTFEPPAAASMETLAVVTRDPARGQPRLLSLPAEVGAVTRSTE